LIARRTLPNEDAMNTHRPEPKTIEPMSVTAFFGYLHEHDATTDLAKALGEVVMLRTCGARHDARRTPPKRLAS
jgi:hypothetical protein